MVQLVALAERPGRPVRRQRRQLAGGLGDVAVLPRGPPAAVDRPDPRRDGKADRRRRPLHLAGPDGRDRRGPARSTSSARPGRRSPTRSCRARSPRAGWTRSASAPDRTSASPARSGSTMSAASRTRPPGRSTAAAGTPSASRPLPTRLRRCSWSGPGRPAWSARSCWGSAGSAPCTWSRRTTQIGGRLRWIRRLPTLGDWGRIVDWRAIQLAKLDRGRGDHPAAGSASADVLEYGAEVVVVATGSSWRGDGVQPHEREPIAGRVTRRSACADSRAGDGRRQAAAGPRVVVYDTDGYYVGPGIAEALAGRWARGRPRHDLPGRLTRVRRDLGRRPAAAPPARQRRSGSHRGVTILASITRRASVDGRATSRRSWSLPPTGSCW